MGCQGRKDSEFKLPLLGTSSVRPLLHQRFHSFDNPHDLGLVFRAGVLPAPGADLVCHPAIEPLPQQRREPDDCPDSLARFDQMGMTARWEVGASPVRFSAQFQNRSRTKNEFRSAPGTMQTALGAIGFLDGARNQIKGAIRTENIYLCLHLCCELCRNI